MSNWKDPRPRHKNTIPQANFIDAIRLRAVLGQLAYVRMLGSLMIVSEQNLRGAPMDEGHLLQALDDAWNLVNHANRARSLVENFPGAAKNSAWKRVYESKTTHLREFRDGFQHADSDLKRITDTFERAWGTLHWRHSAGMEADTHRGFTFMPGWFGGSGHTIYSDRSPRVDRSIYAVKIKFRKKSLKLAPVFEALRGLRKSLTRQLHDAELGDQMPVDKLVHSDVRVLEHEAQAVSSAQGVELPNAELTDSRQT